MFGHRKNLISSHLNYPYTPETSSLWSYFDRPAPNSFLVVFWCNASYAQFFRHKSLAVVQPILRDASFSTWMCNVWCGTPMRHIASYAVPKKLPWKVQVCHHFGRSRPTKSSFWARETRPWASCQSNVDGTKWKTWCRNGNPERVRRHWNFRNGEALSKMWNHLAG